MWNQYVRINNLARQNGLTPGNIARVNRAGQAYDRYVRNIEGTSTYQRMARDWDDGPLYERRYPRSVYMGISSAYGSRG